MKILRMLMMSFAVVALISAGFYGCAAKQEAGQGGMETQQPGEGMEGAEGDGAEAVPEAPPGPSEQPEKVEPARPELALDDVHFAFDSFEIRQSEVSILNNNAAWIKDNANAVVTIEGHCDERGTVEYNLALGEKRANAAKDYLVALGVDASRLKTISYGKSKPLDPASNEAAWAKNRRAHFVVQ